MEIIMSTPDSKNHRNDNSCKSIMKARNRYCHRSRISERSFLEIIKYFAMDIEASKIAALTGVSRNSVNTILKKVRERLVECCKQGSPLDDDAVKIFGSFVAARSDSECLNNNKLPIVGILLFQGKISIQRLPDITRQELNAIIKGKIVIEHAIPSDNPCPMISIVDLTCMKNYRIGNGTKVFSNRKPHINCVDTFWGLVKIRISKFRGLDRKTQYLHLKETEFRYNHRGKDLYKLLLDTLKKNPL